MSSNTDNRQTKKSQTDTTENNTTLATLRCASGKDYGHRVKYFSSYCQCRLMSVWLSMLAGFRRRCVPWWTCQNWHFRWCGVPDCSWSCSTTTTKLAGASSNCGRGHVYLHLGPTLSDVMILCQLSTPNLPFARPTPRHSTWHRASWPRTMDLLRPTSARNCVARSPVRPWVRFLTGYGYRSVDPVALTL